MTTINSVLGPLDASKLGFTLMHEHLIVASAGISQNYAELLGNRFLDSIVNKLTEAKKGGIDTIVDTTTLDLGRDVNLLAEASRRSGVNIVACTGWWLEEPHFLAGVSANQFAGLFVREIEEGIAGTNIKAGVLKSASDVAGVTSMQEAVLRGAARAHHKTGIPIMVHSYSPGQIGRQQVAILKQEGIDLRRVKLDHSNDTTDVGYLTWLLEQGCYLGMDRYPGLNPSSLTRTQIMTALIDAGYAERLLPSHDHTLVRVREDALPSDIVDSLGEIEKQNPHGYLYMKKVVFPQLREMGVPDAIVNRLCIDGPMHFFDGK